MKLLGLYIFVITPCVALFWALVALYQGWCAGWEMAFAEWRK